MRTIEPTPSPPRLKPNCVTSPDCAALVFAMVFPTAITYVYFQLLDGSDTGRQQLAFSIGKGIQFTFPLIWVFLFHRHRLTNLLAAARSGTWRKVSWLPAIGFGLLVVVSLFVAYYGFLESTPTGQRVTAAVNEKVASLGIHSPLPFLVIALFYALVHSLLEEYYWRWFVFDLMTGWVSTGWAILISSLGFAAHHVILLGFYFGWTSGYTYLVAGLIAVGGAFWAWLYDRDRTLRTPWISHLLVDAGIFGLGYLMIRSQW